MNLQIFSDKKAMGKAAAEHAAALIRAAIQKKGRAVLIVATGASQFEVLSELVASPGIDWAKTHMFHLDEYLGLPDSHPASFRKYLRERFVSKVNPGTVVWCEGDAVDPEAERIRVSTLIRKETVDVCLVGVGENGHLAFNDPPADFETEEPYLLVELDEDCRKQQMGEGWFKTLDDVPRKALSMSIRQIMKSTAIVCSVPDTRKAVAVKNCLEGAIDPRHPASILQKHEGCHVYLDAAAASLLQAGRGS